jgi:hypothetical protein
MKTITVNFRCGHNEKLTVAEIKKQNVEMGATFVINGQTRAVSGDYCLACSLGRFTNFRHDGPDGFAEANI